jgi:hypothetical protein
MRDWLDAFNAGELHGHEGPLFQGLAEIEHVSPLSQSVEGEKETRLKWVSLHNPGWMTGVVFPIATKEAVSDTLLQSAKARIV